MIDSYALAAVAVMAAVTAAVSVAAVVLLHVWKRNTLLSIIGGTVCYMVLIRVF